MKFHILVLWVTDLTEIICVFYVLIYTYFIHLCYSESLHNCILKSEKNRVSWFHFVFCRCSAFLICIWLNNSEQFCFGCNQDNIKLRSSRRTGRTGCGRPLGEISVYFVMFGMQPHFHFYYMEIFFFTSFPTAPLWRQYYSSFKNSILNWERRIKHHCGRVIWL